MITSLGGQPEKIVHTNLRLVDASAKDRFELYQDHPESGESSFIGFIGYRMHDEADNVYVLQHTIVAEEYGRQGYARALTTLVLEQLKNQEQKFINQCSYIENYLSRYPEYLGLLAK
ncbi:GNAT family N-acetyltransferase [Yaniella halotolerans]|uniref:GNAT family N-acetyltransferase n=1 Tax=Yaniella halotolerans TaxID=225453 RepID=UPI0003B377A0|nr:GNAT family N-acetyltransferase [Yaniella halotolerans]